MEYDLENKVTSIEAWGDPQNEFIFLEKNVIPLTFAEAKEFLLSVDDKAEPFSIGLYSAKFGISVCSDALDDDEPASSFCMVRDDCMTLER